MNGDDNFVVSYDNEEKKYFYDSIQSWQSLFIAFPNTKPVEVKCCEWVEEIY